MNVKIDKAQEVDQLVGKRLYELRVTLGLSQQQLAERIGVTYQQAHKYERAKNRISAGRLAVIAETLDVPISYFFEEEDKPLASEEEIRLSRISLKAARKFREIDPRYQTAMYNLIKALTN